MSSVLSFAEETCWDGDKFRSIRRPVVFVLEGSFPVFENGRSPAYTQDLKHEFVNDFGLFYDPFDEWLVSELQREVPEIDWGRLIFHRKIDHSAIELIDPDDDITIGKIYPRGSGPQRTPGEALPEGVVCLGQWRRATGVESVGNDSTEG